MARRCQNGQRKFRLYIWLLLYDYWLLLYDHVHTQHAQPYKQALQFTYKCNLELHQSVTVVTCCSLAADGPCLLSTARVWGLSCTTLLPTRPILLLATSRGTGSTSWTVWTLLTSEIIQDLVTLDKHTHMHAHELVVLVCAHFVLSRVLCCSVCALACSFAASTACSYDYCLIIRSSGALH
jgi:hypothetical protein